MMFKKLIIAKNYKGPIKNEIVPQNKFYLYGLRNDWGIINLEYTFQNLKRSLKLTNEILKKIENKSKSKNKDKLQLKILVFINDLSLKPLKFIFKTNQHVQVITKKWTPGTLTKNYSDRKKFPLIIVFSKTNSISISKECQRLKIPVIFFSNLDVDFTNIDYPIPTNTKNIKSLYFLISLFKKIL